MENEIEAFIVNFIKTAQAADNTSRRKTRDMFQVEVAGFSEFIAVNGKVYRYGFVSRNDARTCTLVRAMFDNDVQRFNSTTGMQLQGWSELSAPKLKTHLSTNRDLFCTLRQALPAPIVNIDDSVGEWLQNMYENIGRFNQVMNTSFQTWDEVKAQSTDVEDALRRETARDIDDIRDLLLRATTTALAPPVEDYARDLIAQVKRISYEDVAHFPHGSVELLFACLAAVEPSCSETMYAMLLIYLAAAARKHRFVPVPAHLVVYTGLETSVSRAEFMERYYSTTPRNAQDEWMRLTGETRRQPMHVMMREIPASTLRTFEDFISLVSNIRHALRRDSRVLEVPPHDA